MIILFHLSQQDNHQLSWSDMPLPVKEEVHLEYITHSQRKYNLDYPDDDFYEGLHCTFPVSVNVLCINFSHFDVQLLWLTGNHC